MALRFGLVGLGFHGLHAVQSSFDEPTAVGVELTAVCDVSQERLDAVTRPVEKYLSAEEMIAKAPIDAVYVAVGRDFSYPIVMAALAAGKEVICEKPVANSVEEARAIADEVKRRNRIFAVNFESRYGTRMTLLKRWVDEGVFGKIEAIQFDNLWDCHKSFGPSAARRARLLSLSGGLDCGIHELDQARFLLGGNWKKVSAMGAWFGEPFAPPPHISLVGMLDNGCMIGLNSSLAFTANIEPSVYIDNLYLAGSEGVAVVKGAFSMGDTVATLTSRTRCESVTLDPNGHSSDIALLLTEFAKVVAGGPGTPHRFADAEDGYQAQLAMELAIRDAQKNRLA